MNEDIETARLISRRRQRRYCGYYDYRFPRSPAEYMRNNARRRTREQRKAALRLQRIAALVVLLAIMILLVGCWS